MDRRKFFWVLGGAAATLLVPELWVPKRTYFLPLGECAGFPGDFGISDEAYELWVKNATLYVDPETWNVLLYGENLHGAT